MNTIKIAKAVIKFNDQYLVVQSSSPLKKWEFFGVQVNDDENEISKLSKELKSNFNIEQNIGKLFCEIDYFEMGKHFDIKTYVVKVFDEALFENLSEQNKLLLLTELKTLKWENIDKVIFQKLLEKAKK